MPAPASDPTLGRADHPHLQRQAPNNYNVGITYDKVRLSMRFAMSHNDASIYSYFWAVPGGGVSPNDPVLASRVPTQPYLTRTRSTMFRGSVRMAKGFSLVAYGLNLSNEPFAVLPGQPDIPDPAWFSPPNLFSRPEMASAGE